MTDIYKILLEICEDQSVMNPECDLFETGLLDSYAFIELFSRLEDEGIEIQPTQIDREMLRTPASIEKLIENF